LANPPYGLSAGSSLGLFELQHVGRALGCMWSAILPASRTMPRRIFPVGDPFERRDKPNAFGDSMKSMMSCGMALSAGGDPSVPSNRKRHPEFPEPCKSVAAG